MLKKVRTVRYTPNTGEVNTKDEKLQFFTKDKNTAILHVCGVPDGVTAELVVRPNGGTAMTVTGKTIKIGKDYCVEFLLPVDTATKYEAQIKCQWKYEYSYSNKFEYTSEEVLG